ncbi:hypothetical protein WAF17_21880 [Bernardetia sp. ABR2-2B]
MKTYVISLFAIIALCSASFFTSQYYNGLYQKDSYQYIGKAK